MKVIFVKNGSKIDAVQCEDYLCLEVARSMWKGHGKEGEVVAITERGLLGLKDQSEITSGDTLDLARESFNAGRQYERKLQEEVKLREIDEVRKRQEEALDFEKERERRLQAEGYSD